MTVRKETTPGCVVTKVLDGCPTHFLIPTHPSEYVIGSDEPADMVLKNAFISRRHIAFVEKDGACYARDLGSTNKSRLRNEVMDSEKEYALLDGDPISLAEGELVLIFRTHVMTDRGASGSEPMSQDSGHSVGIFVDSGKHEVYVKGNRVLPEIQNREFDLISLLFDAKGNLVTMKEISRCLWEDRWEYVEEEKDRYGELIREAEWFATSETNPGEIHQLVRRLRRKLSEYSRVEHVQSVRGKGYKLI